MRVSIKHQEVSRGFFFKKTYYQVLCTVHFTELEDQIIRQRGLAIDKLLERVPIDADLDDDPDWYTLTVGGLVERKPDVHTCRTPSEAKAYAATLLDKLHELKQYFKDNEGLGEEITIEIT